MAAPHVAGAAALYLEVYPGDSPAAIASKINGNATSGRLSSIGSGSPNLLLYSLVPPDVDISGPSFIDAAGTHTWEAMPSGGNGTYTYQWKVYWYDTLSYQTLGTSKTQSLRISEADGHFDIIVRVTSEGQTAGDVMRVYNNITCGTQLIC